MTEIISFMKNFFLGTKLQNIYTLSKIKQLREKLVLVLLVGIFDKIIMFLVFFVLIKQQNLKILGRSDYKQKIFGDCLIY